MVRKTEEVFLVYANLVKQHSKGLDDKLQLITGPEQPKLHMPEHPAWAFRIFVTFVYTGRIHTVPVDPSHEIEWSQLRALWELGQELESITFKDAVVDAMMERHASLMRYDTLAFQALGDHLQAPE